MMVGVIRFFSRVLCHPNAPIHKTDMNFITKCVISWGRSNAFASIVLFLRGVSGVILPTVRNNDGKQNQLTSCVR